MKQQKRWTQVQLIIAGLCILLALIIVIDVIVAMITGQYLSLSTPWLRRSVGQWPTLFTIRNLQLLSIPVQLFFFVWALLLIAMTGFYLWKSAQIWVLMALVALLSFWYFPLGSWFGVIVIILLAVQRVQKK